MPHLQVLYYTGSLDVVANINMAEAFLLSTPWSGREAYGIMDRILWKYDKQLAGYVTKVNNFTRVGEARFYAFLEKKFKCLTIA